MKFKIIFLFLLFTSMCFAQDTISTLRQKKYLASNISISNDSVKFKSFSSPEGREYSLYKGDIYDIKYHDGKTIDFLSEEERSKSFDDLKSDLTNLINKFGFDSDSDTKRFYATFEDNYLRLQIKNSKGTKMDKGILYNFIKIYDVHDLSDRTKTYSFINIWVAAQVNPKVKRWEKHKIVMKVKGHEEAEKILRMFKLLHKRILDIKRA